MGGSGDYSRLPGGSDHFSLQTHKQTLHHNIYIIIITTKNNVQLELFLLKKIVQSGDAVKVDSQESNLHSFVDLVATVTAIHN